MPTARETFFDYLQFIHTFSRILPKVSCMGSLQNLPEYGMMRTEDSRPQGGRREQTVAQNTKNVIRKGFIELLEQRSLDKISVVDIAEHCGINRNTVY